MKNKLLLLAVLIGIRVLSSVSPVAKILYMKDTDVASIKVGLGQSTVLSFPARPTIAVSGNKNLFALQYIGNDIAISALAPSARSNLFVYLLGRRFSFSLTTDTENGDGIILVRDAYVKTNQKSKSKWKSKQK